MRPDLPVLVALAACMGLLTAAPEGTSRPREGAGFRAGLTGRVVASDGAEPMAGVRVRLGEGEGGREVAGTVTDAGGRFDLGAVPAGQHLLLAGDPGAMAGVTFPPGSAGLRIEVVLSALLNGPASAGASQGVRAGPSAAVVGGTAEGLLVVADPFRGKGTLLQQRWSPPIVGRTAP
jgi:hypothetical protein